MSQVIVNYKLEPKIYHFIPWNSDKKIGVSYNQSMKMISDVDWACFIDGDAVHTTSYFGKRIEDIVNANPQYSLFTCYTNRIGCPYQIAPGVDQSSNDQSYHRTFGDNLWNQYKTEVMDITKNTPISGVMILIKKEIWKKVGGFKEDKMLAVDNDIHLKVARSGGKVGLMKGIYVQHWYRNNNIKDIKHLI